MILDERAMRSARAAACRYVDLSQAMALASAVVAAYLEALEASGATITAHGRPTGVADFDPAES